MGHVNNLALGTRPTNANQYYILWYKLYKMINNNAASRGQSSDVEISTAIGPERGGLQIRDLTRN